MNLDYAFILSLCSEMTLSIIMKFMVSCFSNIFQGFEYSLIAFDLVNQNVHTFKKTILADTNSVDFSQCHFNFVG